MLLWSQDAALRDVELLLDGAHLPGASRGNIEGGGVGGLGQGTILQASQHLGC